MLAFLSHPSVRVKGTENNYEPILCLDSSCALHATINPHLHCPFCPQTEGYQDPVILKAHYRVKHVDKGIEFAGLKILRCCNSCDIVGSIKGTKEFKGAHWHCYRCRNGFNRRDEALKHFKTHFRNPQTTFQIQIAQDVNLNLNAVQQEETSKAAESLTVNNNENIVTILHPGNGVQSSTASRSGGDNELHVSVAANETVDTSGEQHIMIIAEEADIELETADSNEANTVETASILPDATEMTMTEAFSQQAQLIQELEYKNKQLEQEKAQLEQKYLTEIDQLKIQVASQLDELLRAQQREEELVKQLSVPLTDKVQELITNLRSQHENLLHQQLAQLKSEYYQSMQTTTSSSSLNISELTSSPTDQTVFHLTTKTVEEQSSVQDADFETVDNEESQMTILSEGQVNVKSDLDGEEGIIIVTQNNVEVAADVGEESVQVEDERSGGEKRKTALLVTSGKRAKLL